MGSVPITGDPEADQLLADNPLALLLGMLLDQQIPMEWAFKGPHTLAARMAERDLGPLDAATIAGLGPDVVVELCAAKPAIHRYPASMGKRLHSFCAEIADQNDGDAARVWTDPVGDAPPDARTVLRRLKALPGYGDQKSKIFIAMLAKRFGIELSGWADVVSPYGDCHPRSVADVADPESFAAVRAFKSETKRRAAAAKEKPQ